MAAQSNRAAASIGNGKPEFTYLSIGLLDPGFFRPEGGVLCGLRLQIAAMFLSPARKVSSSLLSSGSRIAGCLKTISEKEEKQAAA